MALTFMLSSMVIPPFIADVNSKNLKPPVFGQLPLDLVLVAHDHHLAVLHLVEHHPKRLGRITTLFPL
jgi:hypothetical protein